VTDLRLQFKVFRSWTPSVVVGMTIWLVGILAVGRSWAQLHMTDSAWPTPLLVLLSYLLGIVAIIVCVLMQRRRIDNLSSLVVTRQHGWVLAVVAATVVLALLTTPKQSLYGPYFQLGGLGALTIGRELLLRAVVVTTLVRWMGRDRVGFWMAIVLASLPLAVAYPVAGKLLIPTVVWEVALNYIFLRSRTILPIYIFFGAMAIVPSESMLLAGLIAIAGYYIIALIAARTATTSVLTQDESARVNG
jgi:hypothetical protein